jgi:ApaG protein
VAAPVPGFSEAVTEGVRISVQSRYLPERSNPMRRQFLFTYEVTITNEGDTPVRLLTRHWVITHADGEKDEVEGVGVIGETPVIEPGKAHTYSSFCPLHTEFGTMHGSYGMVRPSGDTFRAEVAPFQLVLPTAVQ